MVQCLGLANEGVATDGDDCSNRYVGHGRLSQNGHAPTRPELIDLTRPDPTRSAFLLGPAQPGPVDWVGRGGGRVCSGGHGRRGVHVGNGGGGGGDRDFHFFVDRRAGCVAKYIVKASCLGITIDYLAIVCHHGHVCHFLWFRQGVDFMEQGPRNI